MAKHNQKKLLKQIRDQLKASKKVLKQAREILDTYHRNKARRIDLADGGKD